MGKDNTDEIFEPFDEESLKLLVDSIMEKEFEITLQFIEDKNGNLVAKCPKCGKTSLSGLQTYDGIMGDRGDPTDEFVFSCNTKGCNFDITFTTTEQ